MARSRAIFQWVFSLPPPAGSVGNGSGYVIDYLSVSDRVGGTQRVC